MQPPKILPTARELTDSARTSLMVELCIDDMSTMTTQDPNATAGPTQRSSQDAAEGEPNVAEDAVAEDTTLSK